MEAEGDEVAGAADRLAVPGRAEGLRRILDYPHAVPSGDGVEAITVDGQTGEIHGDEGSRPRRNGGFEQIEVKVPGRRIDVHQHRCGAHFEDHVGRGHPGQGGADHLVTGTDPRQAQCHFEGSSAGVESTHTAAAAEIRESSLEGLYLRTAGDPAGAQDVGNRGNGLLVDRWTGEGEKRCAHELATRSRPMMMKPIPNSFCSTSTSPNQ